MNFRQPSKGLTHWRDFELFAALYPMQMRLLASSNAFEVVLTRARTEVVFDRHAGMIVYTPRTSVTDTLL